MFFEQPTQLPLAHAEAFGKRWNAPVTAIERAFSDQRKCARDCARRSAPRCGIGRDFRTAAEARPETGHLSGGSARKEAAILALRRTRGANGTTIDSRGRDPDEEAPVEPGVACPERPVTYIVRRHHLRMMRRSREKVWPFSDMNDRGRSVPGICPGRPPPLE